MDILVTRDAWDRLSPLPGGKPGVSYEAHWGLSQLPFENVPDPKFYFPAPMHEEALHRLLYGVLGNGKLAVFDLAQLGDDILGDAYEYLMRHFATESGKR